jgi:hypothetical protein
MKKKTAKKTAAKKTESIFDVNTDYEIEEISLDELDREEKAEKAEKKEKKATEKKATIKMNKESLRLMNSANIQGEVARLLIDLEIRKINACRIKMSTKEHVLKVFRSSRCIENCDAVNTCSRIHSLIGKKARKVSSGSGSGRLTTGKLTRKESTGKLEFQFENGEIHSYCGDNWKAVTDIARKELKELYPLTIGQCQAVGHKGKEKKFEKVFNG